MYAEFSVVIRVSLPHDYMNRVRSVSIPANYYNMRGSKWVQCASMCGIDYYSMSSEILLQIFSPYRNNICTHFWDDGSLARIPPRCRNLGGFRL